MRKAALILTAALVSVLAGGCQSSNIDENIGSIKKQASEEVKKAFAAEVGEFFESDDLRESLGITGEENKELEESVKSYIDNYSMDKEQLDKAKESVEQLLQNAKGLSAEEIQDKVAKIFE